jgi:CTP:molybdopterin cytidylyltransferase MocA
VSAAAGLILAAGAGRRFGAAPKQLAPLHGRPLLQWAIDAQTAVDPELLAPIVVVLGSHAAEVAAAVDLGRATAVVCDEWVDGHAASLRCGLRALGAGEPGGPSRIVVTLGDAPLVSPAAVARLASEPPGTRAVYDGRPGHPVVLGTAHVDALLRARGETDPPAPRSLLRDARTIELGHLCSGRDVDTPEDLEEVRDEARAVV